MVGGRGPSITDLGERIAKYVPAEVLAFYTSAVNLIATKDGDQYHNFRLWLGGIIFGLFWIATPLWLGRFPATPKVVRTNQAVGFAAFFAWAYAFPAGIFRELGWYEPVIAGLGILVFSLASAFVEPPAK